MSSYIKSFIKLTNIVAVIFLLFWLFISSFELIRCISTRGQGYPFGTELGLVYRNYNTYIFFELMHVLVSVFGLIAPLCLKKNSKVGFFIRIFIVAMLFTITLFRMYTLIYY
jgi:hypothetical protein